jgi:uncharacterized membrane protein YqjE
MIDTEGTTHPRPETAPAEPKLSAMEQVGAMLKAHLDLAKLESQFEMATLLKRAAAMAVAAVLGVTTYVLLQIAFVHGLIALGLPLWAACLIVSAVYAAGIAFLVFSVGKRDAKAGEPFQGTREEWQRSREWIRKRFF